MDTKELLDKYSPFIKRNLLVLSLGILGMIFFMYGLIGLIIQQKSASEEIVFEANSQDNNAIEAKTIIVDVEGAVVRPGLYKLGQDSRLQDGLVAAGGLSASADRNYVAKNLNLATKISDGVKIYVPHIGEAVESSGVPNFININSASQSQLEALPGVGAVTAQKIINKRPYSDLKELLENKVVGSKVFEQIKEKISLY